MNIKIKTTLIILFTFIIGMAAGSMLTQVFFKFRMKKLLSMRAPLGFAAHFERIIQPTDEQRNAVRKILFKYGEKIHQVGQRIREEFIPINEAMHEELNAILTPEQKKRLEERFFRRGPGGFFPPPGDGPPRDRPLSPWSGPPPDKGKPGTPPWLKKHPPKEHKKDQVPK
jgi:hypothetical protein